MSRRPPHYHTLSLCHHRYNNLLVRYSWIFINDDSEKATIYTHKFNVTRESWSGYEPYTGADPGGLWGLETPPPEIYQRSQKSDVLV